MYYQRGIIASLIAFLIFNCVLLIAGYCMPHDIDISGRWETVAAAKKLDGKVIWYNGNDANVPSLKSLFRDVYYYRLPGRNAWLQCFSGLFGADPVFLQKSENCFLYDRFTPNLNIIESYKYGRPSIFHYAGIMRLEENGDLLLIETSIPGNRPTSFDIEKAKDGTWLIRMRRVR